MKTLRFQGFSDDTFGETTIGIDYDNCGNYGVIVLKVASGDKALFVSGQYAQGGAPTWCVGVQPVADGSWPPWPMRLEPATNGYSPLLVIEAPDDVSVTLVAPVDE